jgi:hypothetical protein
VAESEYTEFGRRLAEIIGVSGYSLESFVQAMKNAGYPSEIRAQDIQGIMRGARWPRYFGRYAFKVLELSAEEQHQLMRIRFQESR